MRDATFYASSLLDLDKLEGAAERRASWRQSMAALARATVEEGPGPLEGLHPNALLAGVRAALHGGLVEDLDWLAPAAAGAALYELASALPLGPEQRELGRRVLARLLVGDAETFVAIVRRMALGAGKGLGTPAIRVRVALVTELPLSAGVADGPLSLALASRRDLAREWVAVPSTGSLPSRRLAARLLERAAREASRRAAQGDEHNLRFFSGDVVAPAWERLLADRESLVWRHIAVARGLLSPWFPELRSAMQSVLDPGLSPTEWRRAAASVAASVAVDPEAGLELADRAISQGLLVRDPGASAALLWGLPRAAEAEPEAASKLLDRVATAAATATLEMGEAVVDLRAELGDTDLTTRAADRASKLLAATETNQDDDGFAALAAEVVRDLIAGPRDEESVRAQIERALRAFLTHGAKDAYVRARQVLSTARRSVDALEAVSPQEDAAQGAAGSAARRKTFAVLRDLDLSLLENDVLCHLLSLGPEGARGIDNALDGLRDRLADWMLEREGSRSTGDAASSGTPAHPTLSMRRLRALLHLADGDMGDEEVDAARATRLRKRCVRIARVLLERFERGPASPVRRTIVAALARALDALVRVGACDPIDVLLVVARHVVDPAELRTLAEASMDPDLVHVLEQYAVFADAVGRDVAGALPAYDELTRNLALDHSGRSEALRAVLVRLGGALAAMTQSASLRALAPAGGTDPEYVSVLEGALGSLTQLAIGARARLDPQRSVVTPPGGFRPLTIAVTRVLSGTDEALGEQVVAASLDTLLGGVPRAIAKLVSSTVWRMIELPIEGAAPDAKGTRGAESLPVWLSPRRTIGGFFVVRSLSAGAAGSVFVATRVEDKGEEAAERFALKVPEYSATAARSLSEAEFLKLFREEAGALLALPPHANLARFVTFDAGSKPKPILVMELVEGTTLESFVQARGLNVARALRLLDDVLRGLEAMHSVGVGHLDLKPSNVVLRGGQEAVLVDFGLSGRHIRPGCATGPYGAPEVWGAHAGRSALSPLKADVYAFACVAFEALTGRVLFQADTEMQQIAMHLAHNGFPPLLREFAKRPELADAAELLFAMLRPDPAERPAAAAARKELSRLASALSKLGWPLGPKG
ncbi:MAG TPA: protein kinase [Polyangiaceae bacterium]|nr:protein kinase [Polyangiaceae bacterium]